jgi:hypothetical protein
MASNISAANSGTFVTSNMRPDPDEQIDALHGRNSANNAGHSYYREIPLVDLSPAATGEARYVFTKRPSHNGIKSLSRGLAAGAVTEYIRVFAEGADPTSPGANSAVGTLAYSRAAQATQRFDLNISALTDGNVYLLTYARDTGVSSVRPSVWLTHGSNATY